MLLDTLKVKKASDQTQTRRRPDGDQTQTRRRAVGGQADPGWPDWELGINALYKNGLRGTCSRLLDIMDVCELLEASRNRVNVTVNLNIRIAPANCFYASYYSLSKKSAAMQHQ